MTIDGQIKRIKEKIPKARLSDKNFKIFVAGSHKYKLKSILPITGNSENFRFITYILKKYNQNNIELYIPFFRHSDKEIKKQAIYTAGKSHNKGKYIEDFIDCLYDEEPSIVHSAVQALYGITDPVLLPHFERLLRKYNDDSHYIQSNIMRCLEKFKSSSGIFQKIKTLFKNMGFRKTDC